MKHYKKGLSIVLACSMVIGSGSTVFANALPTTQTNGDVPQIAICPPNLEVPLKGEAVIKEIFEGERLLVKIDDQEVVLKISDETYVIDAQTGYPVNVKDLKAGSSVYVFYSPMMTRSLPPQSNAVAIVTNIVKDKTIPQLFTVKEIVSKTDKSVKLLNEEGDLIITLLADQPISPFKTKQNVTIDSVEVGTQLFVWYDVVALSYPGQTASNKTVILGNVCDDEKEETEDLFEVKPVISTFDAIPETKIEINGKGLALGKYKIEHEEGHVLVPLRVVGEGLGFKVKWNPKTQSVILDDGSVKTEVIIGVDGYYKASSKAIGLTQTFKFGVAPQIKNGTVYVPVQLFNLLYSNNEAVKLVGDTVHINK